MSPLRRALTRLRAVLADRRRRAAVDIDARVRDGESAELAQASACATVMSHSVGPH